MGSQTEENNKIELTCGFKEYAAKVLPGYKPEVLWYLIQRAKANGVI